MELHSLPIIFLDCDGVLSTANLAGPTVWPAGAPDRIGIAQLLRLGRLAAGCHIVLSSTWRTQPGQRAALLQALQLVGIAPEIVISSTPQLSGPTASLEAVRAAEVQLWLSQRPALVEAGALPWVVLDDMHVEKEMPAALRGHCIRPAASVGLTEIDVREALGILGLPYHEPEVLYCPHPDCLVSTESFEVQSELVDHVLETHVEECITTHPDSVAMFC